MDNIGVNPVSVSLAFVKSYYAVVGGQEDRDLAEFYQEDSVCSRGDESKGQLDVVTAKGVQSIRDVLKKYTHTNGAEVRLKTMDCQPTANGGILLVVLGELTEIGTGVVHRFSQTFLLSTNMGLENGVSHYYIYIQNDIFRYLSNENITPPVLNDAHQENNGSTANIQTETKKTEEPVYNIQQKAVSDTNSQPEQPSKPENVQLENKLQTPENDKKSPEVEAKPKEQEKIETKPKTEDIFAKSTKKFPDRNKPNNNKPRRDQNQNHKPSTQSPQTWASVAKSNVPDLKTDVPEATPAPKQITSSKENSNPTTNNEKPQNADDKKKHSNCSLFLKNLPLEIVENDIGDALLDLDNSLTTSDINLKKGFAFVEFPTPELTQKALSLVQKHKLIISGNDIYVEERQERQYTGGQRNRGGGRGKNRGRGYS